MYYFFLLLSAFVGYAIAWVIYRVRTYKVQITAKQQEREIRHLHEDFQRKEKDLNLEIMARDKKITSAQKKYEALQADIQNAQMGLDATLQEQDKLYFALREEYESVKKQIQTQKLQYENLLTEKDRQMANVQAERDNVKLKWESTMQDHAISVLKSDLRLREQEIETLKKDLSKLKEKSKEETKN